VSTYPIVAVTILARVARRHNRMPKSDVLLFGVFLLLLLDSFMAPPFLVE
jgi:uncharacterized protein YhhL (DUF1145 family)